MHEDRPDVKTNLKESDKAQGQPAGALQQSMHASNPGDQDLSGKKKNPLHEDTDVDALSWTQIPHEEIRPELQRDMSQP